MRRTLGIAALLAGACLLVWIQVQPDPPAPGTVEPGSVADEGGAPGLVEQAEGTEEGVGATDREVLRETLPVAMETSLTVSVHWAGDGSPARDIAVRWLPEREYPSLYERRGRTDAQGTVRFEGILPGACGVEIDRGVTASADVVVGSHAQIRIDIPSGIEVHGTVVDDEDRPVPGAGIWLSYGSDTLDKGSVVGNAGSEGRFSLPDVQPGRMVSAVAEGFAPAPLQKIDETAEAPVEVTLEVHASPGTLEGRVVDPEGHPVDNAAILVGRTSGEFDILPPGFPLSPARFARTDEMGLFRVSGLALYPQTVWAGVPGFAVWREQVPMASTGVTRAEVLLLRGATVEGRVLDAAGAPAPRAEVRVLHEDIQPDPVARQVWDGPPWAWLSPRTDEEGRFLLEHLKPGRMKLRATKGLLRTTTQLTLLDGQHATWEARLGSGASIHGVLSDPGGAPWPGGVCSAIRRRGSLD